MTGTALTGQTYVESKTALKTLFSLLWLFFFALYILDWIFMPWSIFQGDDGKLVEWTAISSMRWGSPFDLSIVNPFVGMVSLYIPFNAWLNPSLTVLSLPIDPYAARILGYAILWIEVALTTYVLGRTLGFSPLVSAVAAQLIILFTFPGSGLRLDMLGWNVSMPPAAHSVAVINLLWILFANIGRGHVKRDILFAVSFVVFSLYAFMVAPMFLLAHLPTVLIFIGGLLLMNAGRRKLVYQLAALLACVAAFYGTGAYSYYDATLKTAARDLYYAGFVVPMKDFVEGLRTFPACRYGPSFPMTLPCWGNWNQPIHYVQILSILGALWAIVRAPAQRFIGLAFLGYFASVYLFLFMRWLEVFPNSPAHVWWLYWPGIPVMALLAVSAVATAGRGLSGSRLDRRLSDGLALALSSLVPSRRMAALIRWRDAKAFMALSIVPLIAFVLLAGYTGHRAIRTGSPFTVRMDPREHRTPLIEDLVKEIRLVPNGEFRGFATVFFASKESPIREVFSKDNEYHEDFYYWNKARHYFASNYDNNFHAGYHLWFNDIPTIDEYSAWTSVPLTGYFAYMFADDDTRQTENYLLVYRLNYEALRAMGVRFIISDRSIDDARYRLRRKMAWGDALPLYLYEVDDPNLGNFTPTNVIHIADTKGTVKRLLAGDLRLDRDIIVHDPLDDQGSFVPAQASALRFEPGAIHVTGESEGKSILLLPVQFSRCLNVRPASPGTVAQNVRLVRANIVHTALVFEKQADVRLTFDFNILGDTACRFADLADYERMRMYDQFIFNGYVRRPL